MDTDDITKPMTSGLKNHNKGRQVLIKKTPHSLSTLSNALTYKDVCHMQSSQKSSNAT